MSKEVTSELTVFSTAIDFWKQENSYGFTYGGVDYGVAVVGAHQDKIGQISEKLFKKVSQVLGKTPAEYQTSKGEIASVIAPWVPTATNTTSSAVPELTSGMKGEIEDAITDGSIDIILNGYQLEISEAGAVSTTDVTP